MPLIEPAGAAIYYELHGEGEPVLLLHGFSSSFRRNWYDTSWVSRLTGAGFQVIGLDLRGHGGSARPHDPAQYRGHLLMADILGLLDYLKIDRAHLLGFSMGGGLALQMAMEHPDRSLRVVAGGVGDQAIEGDGDGQRLEEIVAALTAPSAAEVAAPMGLQFRQFAERGDNDLHALAAFLQGRGWPGYIPRRRSDHEGILLVTAELDEWMRGAGELHSLFPRARLLEIPGVRHIPLSADRRFKEAALAFLQAPS